MLAAWPSDCLAIAFDPQAQAGASATFAERLPGWRIAFQHPKNEGRITSAMLVIAPANPTSARPIRDICMRNANGRQTWTLALESLRSIFRIEPMWGRFAPLDDRPSAAILSDPDAFAFEYNRDLSDSSAWRDFPLALAAQSENIEIARCLTTETPAPRNIASRL